jgi:hypothetical protein
VSISLHGHAESRYGEFGPIYALPPFEDFATSGSGWANYILELYYDTLPPGVDEEHPHPISRALKWGPAYFGSQPLPDYVTEVNVQPEILTASFVFEYGVPFELRSNLSLTALDQITMDFDHTAKLSMFEIPIGANLTSGSGHTYPVTNTTIPEPCGLGLLSLGMFVIGACKRAAGRHPKKGENWS